MKKIFVVMIFLLVSLAMLAAGPALALQIIKPSEVKPGMKGYGLTVLSGWKIEKFDVEVIDVMPGALPSSAMILVRCSGAGLEHSRVIAGMSGSPVYLEGKLAGAIAYTWGFSQDPIAGITPIDAMIDAASGKSPAIVASAGAKKDYGLDPSLKPVGCPVLISGLAPGLFPEARKMLEPFDLGPITAGGSSAADPEAPTKLEPGSALGVQLISGDLNLAAVGTVTVVEGGTVLAFGHGFFVGGPVSLPLMTARINTVISSQQLSFKMASPGREIGEMQGDFLTAISGRLGKNAKTIPVRIAVKNQATGASKTFNYKIASHPILSTSLLQICLMQSLSLAGAISENATVSLDSSLMLEGYPDKIRYKDRFVLAKGSFAPDYIAPAMIFITNPYKKVQISGLDFDVEVKPGWDTAEIRSLWANKSEVEPGDTVLIGVRLQRYQGEEFEKLVNFTVPKDARGMVLLNFTGGESMPLDIAPPESVDDLIAAFKKLPNPNWLVMQYAKPGVIVDFQGERLRSLPPRAQSLFSGPVNTQARRSPDFDYETFETPYMVKGTSSLSLKVKPESGRTKK